MLTHDAHYPDAVIQGTFGGGLRFEGNPAIDRNILDLPMFAAAGTSYAEVLRGVRFPHNQNA